jgi:hypothetical protein
MNQGHTDLYKIACIKTYRVSIDESRQNELGFAQRVDLFQVT